MTEGDHYVKIAVLEEQIKTLQLAIARQAAEYESEIRSIQQWQSEYGLWRAKMIGIAIGSGIAGGGVVSLVSKMFQ